MPESLKVVFRKTTAIFITTLPHFRMLDAEILKEGHEWIERELLELEAIMDEDTINYSNLVHVLKKILRFWNEHEKREEEFFSSLEQRGYTTPLHTVRIEQATLKRLLRSLTDAIVSGSDYKTRSALEHDGRSFIVRVRNHIKKQDWILYALPAMELHHAVLPMPEDLPFAEVSSMRAPNSSVSMRAQAH